jgi:hypothetical protein
MADLTDFQKLRLRLYPDVKDQLDMLYHDIKNGNLENGTWVKAIEDVKNEVKKG